MHNFQKQKTFSFDILAMNPSVLPKEMPEPQALSGNEYLELVRAAKPQGSDLEDHYEAC